jgi:hypothetical protein
LAYSSSWTYGIPQATTTLSKAISFWIMEANNCRSSKRYHR